jgi:hypothetical protein
MHATTQPTATNNLPGAARAAVIAAIVIVAAVAGFLTGNAMQGSQGSLGGFSAGEIEFVDQSVQIARQEASIVAPQQAQMFEDLGLLIARQVASAVGAQTSPPTWETDHNAPVPR